MSALLKRRRHYARMIREYLDDPGDPETWGGRFVREIDADKANFDLDEELLRVLNRIFWDYDFLDVEVPPGEERWDRISEPTFRQHLREYLTIIESRL